jgi:hypothetical protein
MTFTQVTDILRRIEQVHHEVGRICSQVRHDDNNQRRVLLIDFFQQSEKRLGQRLEPVQNDRNDPMVGRNHAFLDTWIQFPGTEEIDAALEAIRDNHADNLDDLIGKCLDLHERVLRVLDHLAQSPGASDVRERLANVAAFERKAARDLGTAIVMHRDA